MVETVEKQSGGEDPRRNEPGVLGYNSIYHREVYKTTVAPGTPDEACAEGGVSQGGAGRAPPNIFLNGRYVYFEEWKRSHGIKDSNAVYPVIVPDATLTTNSQVFLNPGILPGTGKDCGLEDKFTKKHVECSSDPDHDHYEVGGTSCGRPECPRHWKTWARRASDRAGRILWGYKTASKGRHNPRQTVLSIDDDDPIVKKREGKSDKSNLVFFRKYFIKKALKLGGAGGSITLHLLRTNDELPNHIPDERRWDWIREQNGWRKYTKFSPHAHIIGFGFYSEPVKGDFSYKNFDALEDRDAVESVAYYTIQHALVGIGNVISYWGCCQPGCMKVISKGTERKPIFCKKCGAPMVYAEDRDEYSGRRSWAVYEIVEQKPRKKKNKPIKIDRTALIWGPAGIPATVN